MRSTRAGQAVSIQPRRPMLVVLQEVLRKLESSGAGETTDLAQLKRILRSRILEIENTQNLEKQAGPH